jgi:D-alanyl-D-alanine dipeptidase
MNDDFAFVDEYVPGIRWDAKYATWDNFTGRPVDGYQANRIVGSRALCAALDRAREKAASEGIGLLLWDGYRPQRAVDCFVRWSTQPEDGRTKTRHYPNLDRAGMFDQGYVALKSGHTRGSAVDLTLYDLATGDLAPMGGDHDLMDPVSHHGATGITPAETRNRQHLCSIMADCGFDSYAYEWWHYSLKHEPYPNTYFDFAITQAVGTAVRGRG